MWGLRSWLRHYATSSSCAGAIPDGVIGFFSWPNPFPAALWDAKWIFSVQSLTLIFCRSLWMEFSSWRESQYSFYICPWWFSEVDPVILNCFFSRIGCEHVFVWRTTTYECTVAPIRLVTEFGVAGIIPSESAGKALLCSSWLFLQEALRIRFYYQFFIWICC
jgi:hypothetical protein